MIYASKVTHYQLRQLEEAYPLAHAIAQSIPNGMIYLTGIYELMLNALEHGNLGIGFVEKSALLRDGQWEIEIKHRLMLNQHKSVFVTLTQNRNTYELTIRDEGNGFNWRDYMVRTNKHEEIHGRGLSIAVGSKFDRLFYNDAGNQVTCIIEHRPWESTPAECQLMSWNKPLSAKEWAI